VEYWFKSLAYACILLREAGYPCVFYPDWFGARYRDKGGDGKQYDISIAPVPFLEKLVRARKDKAYGFQHDFFDHPRVIGWTREGDEEKPGSGLAVLMSTGDAGWKWMLMGKPWAGKTMRDALGTVPETITVNEDGWARFVCPARSLAVWVSA